MTTETFTVWAWRPGQSWRRVLDNADPATMRAHVADLEQGTTRAAFSSVLDFNPNHASADDIAELADDVHGPIPATAHRRHAA